MKYLIYFRPDERVAELIGREKEVVIPSAGIHCTLAVFMMQPEREEQLIRDLETIVFAPLMVKTAEFARFDNDAYVLRLTRPADLLDLHTAILECALRSADDTFVESAARYFGPNYAPHITIAKASVEASFNRDLLGQEFPVNEFYVAKKDEQWKEIGRLGAK